MNSAYTIKVLNFLPVAIMNNDALYILLYIYDLSQGQYSAPLHTVVKLQNYTIIVQPFITIPSCTVTGFLDAGHLVTLNI